MSAPWPPVALVYDRTVTGDRAMLQGRLLACAAFARERGWVIGGWFGDSGADALSDRSRPGFDHLLNFLGSVEADRERIVLLYDWGRLSHGVTAQARLLNLVRHAGGQCRSVQQHAGDCHVTSPGALTRIARSS